MDSFEKPVEEIIRLRKSVRTFDPRPIEEKDAEILRHHMKNLDNPFGATVRVDILEDQPGTDSRKLGTYGVIRGCSTYMGAAVTDGPLCLEALGYAFEKLILHCTAMGLGTCWLGGTFKRSAFADAMNLQSGELFPAVSPIGYSKVKQTLMDSLVRAVTNGDKRKAWENLFFRDSFDNPLEETEAGEYRIPLEMVRLAPSASNKQPWRIVMSEGAFHFFESRTPGYASMIPYDLQRIDLGIAACHFELAALEEGLSGCFTVSDPLIKMAGPDVGYVFTWRPV